MTEISLDHAALAQLLEDGELTGLSAVTLPNDESGTELVFEQSEEHSGVGTVAAIVALAAAHFRP